MYDDRSYLHDSATPTRRPRGTRLATTVGEHGSGTQPAGAPVPSGAVARNAFHLVLGQASTTVLAIVLSASLARYLGAADFGLYFLIFTMATFAYVVAEWGQPMLVIREVAQDPLNAGRLVGTALAMRVVLAVAIVVPAWLLSLALGYDLRTRWLSVGLIAAMLPFFLAQGYGMVFRARDRMGLDAGVSVANKALGLGLTVAALAAGWSIVGIIGAQAVSGVAALVLASALYRRLRLGPLGFSSRTARVLLVDGMPILAMTAASAVQPYLDAVLLSKLAPANVVGWFGAAKTILGTLMAPATILGAAAFPSFSRASADPAALRREMRAALRPLVFLGALAGVGTFLFADMAIGLIYGKGGFGPAATILRVFAPALFLIFLDTLLGHVIYASGRGTGFAIAKVASVLLGTGLNILLIPFCQARYGNGGIGVVMSFAISELVVFGGCIFVLRRQTFEPAMGLDVARALAAAAATAGLFRLLPAFSPWLGMPLCVAAFAAIAMAVGLIAPRDILALRAVVSRRQPTAA
jgi:O-antigen/teichoic acid export membrane protein